MPLLDVYAARVSPKHLRLPPDREAEAVLHDKRNWAPDLDARIPKKVGDFALKVRVNHGRWIVECPCSSAQLASRTDRRFFCVECGNVLFGGDWVKVQWPRNHKAIEQILLERPLRHTRNWEPGETLAELRDENDLHAPETDAIISAARGGG